MQTNDNSSNLANDSAPVWDGAERRRPPGPEAVRHEVPEPPKKRRSITSLPRWIWVMLVASLLLNWLIIDRFSEPDAYIHPLPYSVFKDQAQAGNVAEVVARGSELSGTLRRPISYAAPGAAPQSSSSYTTRLPAFGDTSLLPLLESKDVVLRADRTTSGRNTLISILLSFVPTLLIFGMLFYLLSKAQGGGGMLGLGRSRAKRYDASGDAVQIMFADVAGIEEAENELVEIVDFLKNPLKYQRLGGTIPKGVLLVGPPGTGKTLLAKAVAGEAGTPFFSMSGSEFIEMVVGVGASRVRELFAQAKKVAPAIIFVDELDAIGRRRGANSGGGANDEREQTLNQLLVEMDGFDSRQAVIVIAATNRPDVLDPALLRPGRFDRRVTVQRPDRTGRHEILKVHTRGVPLDKSVNLGALAAATPGLTGADLRNLVNEAALLAARNDQDAIAQRDFFAAMEKIVLGAERHIILTEQDRTRIAYHEAGHALLGLLSRDPDLVHKVTIVPRGQSLGVTVQGPESDRYNYTEEYLLGRIVAILGGRAAEQLVFATATTGAENDLKQAGELARQMVSRWGMSEKIGLLYLSPAGEEDFLGPSRGLSKEYSETLATAVDAETRRILDECYDEAFATLTRERFRLDALAEALLREESLDKDQILEIVDLPKGLAPIAEALLQHPSPV